MCYCYFAHIHITKGGLLHPREKESVAHLVIDMRHDFANASQRCGYILINAVCTETCTIILLVLLRCVRCDGEKVKIN